MCVPAHDVRDFAFAAASGLPVRPVLRPPDTEAAPVACHTGTGVMLGGDGHPRVPGAPVLAGLEAAVARAAVVAWLETAGIGGPANAYRLRDWLFSRQRCEHTAATQHLLPAGVGGAG
jgi:leucyl-tRNA synthetase